MSFHKESAKHLIINSSRQRISNAFDIVWHSGLIKKFYYYDISVKFFAINSSFMLDTFIKGHHSYRVGPWKLSYQAHDSNVGLPQVESSRTIFLLHMNDLPNSILRLLDNISANDTPLYGCTSYTIIKSWKLISLIICSDCLMRGKWLLT